MNELISIRFESRLFASRERVWDWITSVEGISTEMWPILRMTAPKSLRSLADVQLQPGIRMFRSYVFLFGVLPVDYSDMTLIELTPGIGFVEQSPMGSMKLWRHERHIVSCPSDSSALVLIDQLTFQPRIAPRLVGWFLRRVFRHRHKVLRRHLQGD